MRRNLNSGSRGDEQIFGSLIEDHGIAAGNVLDKRVLEVGLASELG